MQKIETFSNEDSYDLAILIKDSAFNKNELYKHYVEPIEKATNLKCIVCSVPYNEANKAPVSLSKAFLKKLLPAIHNLGIEFLLVADTAYFKAITKVAKTAYSHGYVVPSKLEDVPEFNVTLIPNYQALLHNPDFKKKIDTALNTVIKFTTGDSSELGDNIIKTASYPSEPNEIIDLLHWFLDYPALAVDIETDSLSLSRAELKTISFAYHQNKGMAFAVDTEEKKHILAEFFKAYKGHTVYHNASYDVTILIRHLFEDQLEGLQVMTKKIQDTKLITYLANNSTTGNSLGLKDLAYEFAGDYGVDHNANIPLEDLLIYNLKDTLSTVYVFEREYPKLEAEGQLSVYEEIFLPSLKNIIHMQLNGLPMNMQTILETKKEIEGIKNKYLSVLNNSELVKNYEWELQKKEFIKTNAKLKKKIRPIEEFVTTFNPNSGQQLGGFLFDYLGLPIINRTDTGQPSTDKETLETLLKQLEKENEFNTSPDGTG